jgi:hypothetical protein
MIDIDRRTFSRLGIGAISGAALSPLRALAADAYPSRPIHLLVGFTPGSSSDITGRVFANGAAQILGQRTNPAPAAASPRGWARVPTMTATHSICRRCRR